MAQKEFFRVMHTIGGLLGNAEAITGDADNLRLVARDEMPQGVDFDRLVGVGALRKATPEESDAWLLIQANMPAPAATRFTTGNETPVGQGAKGAPGDLSTGGVSTPGAEQQNKDASGVQFAQQPNQPGSTLPQPVQPIQATDNPDNIGNPTEAQRLPQGAGAGVVLDNQSTRAAAPELVRQQQVQNPQPLQQVVAQQQQPVPHQTAQVPAGGTGQVQGSAGHTDAQGAEPSAGFNAETGEGLGRGELSEYTVIDLKGFARARGLEGYSGLNKDELLDLLTNGQ